MHFKEQMLKKLHDLKEQMLKKLHDLKEQMLKKLQDLREQMLKKLRDLKEQTLKKHIVKGGISSVWEFLFILSYNLERCKSTQWEFDVKWCIENNKLQAAAGKADWSSDWRTDWLLDWIHYAPSPSLWFEVGIIFLMLQPLDCNFVGYPSTNKWITWIKGQWFFSSYKKNLVWIQSCQILCACKIGDHVHCLSL